MNEFPDLPRLTAPKKTKPKPKVERQPEPLKYSRPTVLPPTQAELIEKLLTESIIEQRELSPEEVTWLYETLTKTQIDREQDRIGMVIRAKAIAGSFDDIERAQKLAETEAPRTVEKVAKLATVMNGAKAKITDLEAAQKALEQDVRQRNHAVERLPDLVPLRVKLLHDEVVRKATETCRPNISKLSLDVAFALSLGNKYANWYPETHRTIVSMISKLPEEIQTPLMSTKTDERTDGPNYIVNEVNKEAWKRYAANVHATLPKAEADLVAAEEEYQSLMDEAAARLDHYMMEH